MTDREAIDELIHWMESDCNRCNNAHSHLWQPLKTAMPGEEV